MKNLLLFLLLLASSSVFSATWYVKTAATGSGDGSSFADATTLHSALSLTADGDVVNVFTGTYIPHASDKSIYFNVTKNITITGGFSGASTLSGNLAGATESIAIIKTSGTITLENFTIQDGDAAVSNGGSGFGVIDMRSGTLTMNNCTVQNNTSNQGALFHMSGSVILNDCVFQNNAGETAAAYFGEQASSYTITRCKFINNTLNPVSDNYSNAAGGINMTGTCYIRNSEFRGNTGGTAATSGAVIHHGSDCYIENCSFSGNTSAIYYVAGSVITTDVYLRNSILYGNTNEITNGGGGVNANITVLYSCVQGGASGTGNISSDPAYTSGANLHLTSCSPCINAGNNTYASGTDLDGGTRILQVTTDMGAYETNFSSGNPVAEIVGPDATSTSCTAVYSATVYATGYTYNWNFGVGATPATATGAGPHNVSWSSVGSKTVALTVTGGCAPANDSKTVTVSAGAVSPTSTTVTPTTVCEGDLITLTPVGGSAIAEYSYTYRLNGASAPQNIGVSTGSLTVTERGSGFYGLRRVKTSCGSYFIVVGGYQETFVTVNPAPTADISTGPTGGCVSSGNSFSATSAGVGASYAWTFPLATVTSGTGQGPLSRTWTSAGNYNVKLEVTKTGCTSVDYHSILIEKNPTTPNVISAAPSTTINGGESVTLTSGGGNGGTLTWYSGGCGSGAALATGSNVTFSPGATTTYYVRSETNSCGNSACRSITITVNICDNVTSAGSIFGNQTGCGTYDPVSTANGSSPSGGSGALQYQWQNSPDNSTWSNIGGANSSTYNPPSISSTTYYRRGARRSGCTPYLYTSSLTMTVTVNYTSAGSISGNQSNCGSYDPTTINNSVSPSGGSGGSPRYIWQSSPDGSSWSTIGGATSITYNPPTIASTTHYRRGSRRFGCPTYLYSNTVIKTVSGGGGSPNGTVTWTGTENTSWNNACNWTPSVVPTILSLVVLPGSTGNMPSIGAGVTANCLSLTINGNSTITIDSDGGAVLNVDQ